MPYDKLYVRIACTACNGSRLSRAYQSPVDNRWSRCPYCGPSGKVYVSIELTALMRHIDSLDPEDFRQLRAYINERAD